MFVYYETNKNFEKKNNPNPGQFVTKVGKIVNYLLLRNTRTDHNHQWKNIMNVHIIHVHFNYEN